MNRGTFWIALVVALLLGNATAVGVLLAKSGDPSDRVLPNYYRRAIDWDRTVEALRASDALGWTVGSRLVAIAPDRGRVIVTITGADGAPVVGAVVDVDVRHRSVAAGAHGVLAATAPGQYEGEIPLTGLGLHVIDIHASSAELHYGGSATVELEP